VGFKVDTLAMDHHVAARRPSPDGYARTPALELERADNRKRSRSMIDRVTHRMDTFRAGFERDVEVVRNLGRR